MLYTIFIINTSKFYDVDYINISDNINNIDTNIRIDPDTFIAKFIVKYKKEYNFKLYPKDKKSYCSIKVLLSEYIYELNLKLNEYELCYYE